MEAYIKYCKNCASKNITNDYQDTTYGKFQRLMNPTGKGSQSAGCKCTVCGDKIKV